MQSLKRIKVKLLNKWRGYSDKKQQNNYGMSREQVKDSWLKWNNCTEEKGAEYGALDMN